MPGNRSECPECNNMTLKEGEVRCEYCRSAIGISGSVMIVFALIGLVLFMAAAVGAGVFVG